jgi:hypothetical protein
MTSDQLAVAFGLLVTVVAVLGTFTFVSIVVFTEGRRKEREAFYRAEVHKKLLEQAGGSADQLRALLQLEAATRSRQTREGLRIGGLATGAAGAAMLLISTGGGDWVAWRIGGIPLAIGLAILACSLLPVSGGEPGRPRT